MAAILPTVKVRAVADLDERVSAKSLALGLPKHAWRTITWRDGSADPLRSRFARVRVRTAPNRGAAARQEETLLIEWPEGEAAPTKYWLSNIAKTISFRELVDIAKMRWRIERDYQDLKQEIGLGHHEGRGWRGVPPSRHAVYRGLWIPDLRAGDDSPLRTTFRRDVRETCHFRRLPTPRRRRCGPNATSPTRSRPSIAQWWSRSPGCCRAGHVARADFNETCDEIYDAVVLGSVPI